MGLYRFHVRDAFGLVEDEEGVELPDLYAALAEALHCTHELMEDTSVISAGMQFEIADETVRVILMVPLPRRGDRQRQGTRAHAA